MKLIGTKIIRGQIVIKTGLHIGGDTRNMEIGGMDNPILRNPSTGEPYIPGSSIKGKMRALYEMETGRYNKDKNDKNHYGYCCNCGQKSCPSCTVFGSANNSANSSDLENHRGPTRLIVRDAFLSREDHERFVHGENLVEEKNENALNRITAAANPRPVERVLPGVTFDFEMVFRMYDENDKRYLDEVVLHAMKVLESDYLGGGGTRGSGKIKFTNVQILDGEHA